MIPRPIRFIPLTALLCTGVNGLAQSLQITGVVSETIGSTAEIPGSGGPENTDNWSTGTVGEFILNGGAYYMVVSALNPTGSLESGGNPVADSLMVARTVNSQGLTDDGMMSLYVRTGTTNSDWSLQIRFSFFEDAGYTQAATINNFTLTSLDIDFDQRYHARASDFFTNTTYANTDINAIAPTDPIWIASYNGFTSGGNSTFDDPRHAVTSVGTGFQLRHHRGSRQRRPVHV